MRPLRYSACRDLATFYWCGRYTVYRTTPTARYQTFIWTSEVWHVESSVLPSSNTCFPLCAGCIEAFCDGSDIAWVLLRPPYWHGRCTVYLTTPTHGTKHYGRVAASWSDGVTLIRFMFPHVRGTLRCSIYARFATAPTRRMPCLGHVCFGTV